MSVTPDNCFATALNLMRVIRRAQREHIGIVMRSIQWAARMHIRRTFSKSNVTFSEDFAVIRGGSTVHQKMIIDTI